MKTTYIPRTDTLSRDQRDALEHATDLANAKTIASWACAVVAVTGGFMAFESALDLETWENQV